MNTPRTDLTLINEFAEVRIRIDATPGNQHVELHAPRYGRTARLDTFLLELLARMGPEFLSDALQEVYEASVNDQAASEGDQR